MGEGQDIFRTGKIAVLIEAHFDEHEYRRFNEVFPTKGFQVEYLSYLWGQPSLTFEGNDGKESVTVKRCVTQASLSDYDALILVGGYAMDRLRYQEEIVSGKPNQAPAVVFLRKALKTPKLTVGTICHSLWLFCADSQLLRGRKVTCAHNIVSDVKNAGGRVQFEGNQTKDLHIDGNLVTGKHPQVVDAFMDALEKEINRKRTAPATTAV